MATPRRATDRVIDPIEILVFWRKGEAARFEAFMCDLSPGGCFLNTKGEVAEGESITIEVPTASTTGSVIEFSGFVIPQVRELQGFGVKFGSLSGSQQSLITQLIEKAKVQPDPRSDR